MKHPQFLNSRKVLDPPATTIQPATGVTTVNNATSDNTAQSSTNIKKRVLEVDNSNSEAMVGMDDEVDPEVAPMVPPSTAPTEQQPHQQPLSKQNPRISDDELIQQMANDIVTKAEMGEQHLSDIFLETERYWNDQLLGDTNKKNDDDRMYRDYTDDEFQSLWNQVLEYCLEEKFPYYSLARNNWKDVTSLGSTNTTAPSPTTNTAHSNDTNRGMMSVSAPYILEWDTVELITLEDFKRIMANSQTA